MTGMNQDYSEQYDKNKTDSNRVDSKRKPPDK